MRISLIIISLFTLLSASAQNIETSQRTNINTYAPRRAITPYATEAGAQSGEEQGVRYTLPLKEWQRTQRADTTFMSADFITPFSWLSRQAIIRIESAAMPYTLIVDSVEVGRCVSASLPAEFNITKALDKKSSTITIALTPDKSAAELEGWSKNTDKELGEVVMISQPSLYLRDMIVESSNTAGVINSSIALISKSEMLNSRTSRLRYTLRNESGGLTLDGSSDITLEMRQEDTTRLFVTIPDSLAWSATSPHLFSLSTQMIYRNRREEFQNFKLGFRTIEIDEDGAIVINSQPIELKTKSVESNITSAEMEKIKADGYNTILIGAGEYNSSVYNTADSIGLYIIATIPINTSHSGATIQKGGNPTNDPTREAEFLERSQGLYFRVRNHPSVIAFALADNSLNGYNLYESYLYLKSQEPQRPIIYRDGGGEWNSDKLNGVLNLNE